MQVATKKSKDGFDHRFKAIHDREVPWESDDIRGLLKLPPGVKVKVLNYDPVMKRLDMKQRFPAGYVEPAHTHRSWHSILVTRGRMCVAGKDLARGRLRVRLGHPARPLRVSGRVRGVHRLHGRCDPYLEGEAAPRAQERLEAQDRSR